jgi:hypothetical protein
MTKVNIAGGMTYKVYNKQYTHIKKTILMYGSGVWATKTFSVISSVQLEHVNTFYLLENIRPMYHRTVTCDGHPVTLTSV